MKIIILLLFVCGCATTPDNSSKIQIEMKQKTKELKVSVEIFKTEIAPGDTRKITVGTEGIDESASLSCNGVNHTFYIQNKKMIFFMVNSYFSKKESLNCTVTTNLNEKYKIVQASIYKKKYELEYLHVDKKRIQLSKKDLARVIAEQKVLNKVYASGKRTPRFNKSFVLPMTSFITSSYGKKRIYNNHKQGQHLGIDFRAAVGVPINTSNSGKVLFAGDLFYTGNTVIVDHGVGIFTVYGHLSKIVVKSGESVAKQALVGLAGMTGRVTGPHLHWGVKIHGQWIDGASLVSTTAP